MIQKRIPEDSKRPARRNVILRKGVNLTQEKLKENLRKEIERRGDKEDKVVHVVIKDDKGNKPNTLLEIKNDMIYDIDKKDHFSVDENMMLIEIFTRDPTYSKMTK
jgi:hypothetical protein